MNLGIVSIVNGLELSLVSPFDTVQSNNSESLLNHLGQNLNVEDVSDLLTNLTEKLSTPDNSSDSYRTFREWKKGDVYEKKTPHSAHGSNWSSIIIGKESTT